jgi:cytochrome c oxidase subunit 4
MKDFFENPELLLGVPVLIIGLIGLAIPVLNLLVPEKKPGEVAVAHHPDDLEYFKIFVTLAVITLIEVGLFYIDMSRNALIPTLIVLSGLKFFLVVAWFMHLRFDSRLFTTAFVSGMALAAAVFTVVIATLGANLV